MSPTLNQPLVASSTIRRFWQHRTSTEHETAEIAKLRSFFSVTVAGFWGFSGWTKAIAIGDPGSLNRAPSKIPPRNPLSPLCGFGSARDVSVAPGAGTRGSRG